MHWLFGDTRRMEKTLRDTNNTPNILSGGWRRKAVKRCVKVISLSFQLQFIQAFFLKCLHGNRPPNAVFTAAPEMHKWWAFLLFAILRRRFKSPACQHGGVPSYTEKTHILWRFLSVEGSDSAPSDAASDKLCDGVAISHAWAFLGGNLWKR